MSRKSSAGKPTPPANRTSGGPKLVEALHDVFALSRFLTALPPKTVIYKSNE